MRDERDALREAEVDEGVHVGGAIVRVVLELDGRRPDAAVVEEPLQLEQRHVVLGRGEDQRRDPLSAGFLRWVSHCSVISESAGFLRWVRIARPASALQAP